MVQLLGISRLVYPQRNDTLPNSKAKNY